MVNVRFSGVKDFVITGRNKEGTIFYIRPKSDFMKEVGSKSLVITPHEGFAKDTEIVSMMEDDICFCILSGNAFLEVTLSGGLLTASEADSSRNCIDSLPIVVE